MNKKTILLLIVLSLAFTACKSTKAAVKLTPHQLLKNNMVEQAKNEFMAPSEINEIDEDGNTVLHLAALRNDGDLCTFFIINIQIDHFISITIRFLFH